MCLFLALTGCAGLQVDLRPRATAEPAPNAPLEIAWSYNARAGFGPDAAQSFDGYILVGTRQGEVHVIEEASGRRVGTKRFGDVVNGAPVVVGRTLVVPVAAGRSALIGYDLRRAQVLWRRQGTPIHTGLVVVDQDVILVDLDGTVQRIRSGDGELVWAYELPEMPPVHARPVVTSNMVVIADEKGRVYNLDTNTGELIWTTTVRGPVGVTPAIEGGRLVVSTTRGRLCVLDVDTGEDLWHVDLPDTTVRFTTPAVRGSQVVVGASDGLLRMWDIDANVLNWTFDGGEAQTAAPVMTGHLVYVGSMGRRLYAIRKSDGTLAQEIELRGRIKSSLAVQSDALIVLTEPRYVVRLTQVNGGA